MNILMTGFTGYLGSSIDRHLSGNPGIRISAIKQLFYTKTPLINTSRVNGLRKHGRGDVNVIKMLLEIFRSKQFLYGVSLFFLLAACRLPWIGCDAGVPALWDYGYFCTDEGYYTLEGRYLYLTGRIFDPLLMGSGTLMNAPLQHFLCFLSYQCFGLNDWAHRVPVMIISISAWLGIFIALSRRTAAWLACVIVGIVACNPVSLVYERTASSDVLMGSLAVLAFLFAWRRSFWSVMASAALLALAYGAKVSCVGIIPLVFLTIIAAREQRWHRGLCFAVSFLVFLGIGHYALNALIGHIAVLERMSFGDVLKVLGRGAAVPGMPSVSYALKTMASFPRWTTSGVLGVALVLTVIIPLMALIGRLFAKVRRWDRCVALYLGMMIYIVSVDVGRGQFYVRHTLPLFYYIPILIFCVRKELPAFAKIASRQTLLFMLTACLVCEAIFWLTPLGQTDPKLLVPYFVTHHNASQVPLWGLTWRIIVPTVAALGLMVWGFQKFRKMTLKRWGLILGVSFVIAHVLSTGWPLFRFGFMEALAKEYIIPLVMLHVLLVVTGACWLLPWPGLRHWKTWYACVAVVFIASWLINPYWRSGTMQLASRKWEQRSVVKSLEQYLPDNAVVFGDRSMSLLMGSRLSAGCLFGLTGEALVTQIERIAKSNKTVFLLFDREENIELPVVLKYPSRIQCQKFATIVLPSHGNGGPMECQLVRLECVKK